MRRVSLSQTAQLTTPAAHCRSAPWQCKGLQGLHAISAYGTYLASQEWLAEAVSDAVTLIQRFGRAASLYVDLHCLVPDGVCRRTDGEPAFVEVAEPSDQALHVMLHDMIAILMKLLTRHGLLVEEQGTTYLADDAADSDDARALRPLQAAACTYRIAFGPRAGHKVFTLRGAMPRDATFTQVLCADEQGFSLHATVRCDAHERQRLEQLCR